MNGKEERTMDYIVNAFELEVTEEVVAISAGALLKHDEAEGARNAEETHWTLGRVAFKT